MKSEAFGNLLSDRFSNIISMSMEERFSSEIFSVSKVGTDKVDNADEVIVLTLSGNVFRIFISIVFNKSQRLEELVKHETQSQEAVLENIYFYDYFYEVGNVLCGSLKREIQKVIPSLGMSTPNLMDVKSFQYISALGIDYKNGYLVSSNEEPLFYIQYYLGVYDEIEFQEQAPVDDVFESGEMEFF